MPSKESTRSEKARCMIFTVSPVLAKERRRANERSRTCRAASRKKFRNLVGEFVQYREGKTKAQLIANSLSTQINGKYSLGM
jgi:hypothetical protein